MDINDLVLRGREICASSTGLAGDQGLHDPMPNAINTLTIEIPILFPTNTPIAIEAIERAIVEVNTVKSSRDVRR